MLFSHFIKTWIYLRSYHAGAFDQAECHLNQLVQKKRCQGEIIRNPKKLAGYYWIVPRHVLLWVKSMKPFSIMKKLSKHSILRSRSACSTTRTDSVLQDEQGAYQAEDFEQVLARVYFALALLHQGDESNAYAVLRQAEEYQQYRREVYTKIPFTRHYHLADNGLSKYLFATLLKKRGDPSNAQVLYSQALQLLPYPDPALNCLFN